MPRGDRTGPYGMGPMTGREAGYCTGSSMPGYVGSGAGRGFGMGFRRNCGTWGRGFAGGGMGRRNMFRATGQPGWMHWGGYGASGEPPVAFPASDPEMDKQLLKRQAAALQSQLEVINKRLAELDSGTDT